jgi:REP-associated tyrosine transposase
MPERLKRYYGCKHLHFITCSCYRRLPLLGSAQSRNIFAKILGEVRGRYNFALIGYVVMPEHIHLLITEPAKGTPSTVMQVLKQLASRALRYATSDSALPQFWQVRFYDFNIWSHKKKIEKLGYMHLNPVKRALVAHPGDWVWSSYSYYANRRPGLVPIDTLQVSHHDTNAHPRKNREDGAPSRP